jgi:hypothetical protein
MMMNGESAQALHQAYRILGELYKDAWFRSAEVPVSFAMMLMHARDYIGQQLHRAIVEGEP